MYFGREYNAYDLLELWDRYKDSPILCTFERLFRANKDAIEQQFIDDGVAMPEDVQDYLDKL